MRGFLTFRRHIPWLAVLAACAPAVVSAKPVGAFRFLVAEPGDQTRPSIDGQFVVYQGPGAAGETDVLLYNGLTGKSQVIAGAPGDHDQPDVSLSAAIYRGPLGISIEFWQTDQHLRDPPPGGDGTVSAPAIGTGVAAWEVGKPGARDIRVSRWAEAREWTLPAPDGGPPVGDQLAPAAFDDLVAYVDAADGRAAWLYDSAVDPAKASPFQRLCDGVVSSVSIGRDGADRFVAVARSIPGHDEDVEVWRPGGTSPVAALRVPGVQRNPHLSGPWVAFEDVSTTYSQVVVWNWRTGLVFVPHPSATQQVLNDLSLLDAQEVRVVFEDSFSPATGKDVALYVLDISPLVDDGTPDGYPIEPPPPDVEPARCDGTATPLATLHLGRGKGKPLADEIAFDAPPPEGATRMPVLVCMDADRVSSAWVTLDDEAIARPSDFNPGVVHLEAQGEVVGGAGRLSGLIAGKPGASLDVRVYADPARLAQAAARRQAAAAAPGAGAGGCAAGRGGIAALVAVALLLARRRPERG